MRQLTTPIVTITLVLGAAYEVVADIQIGSMLDAVTGDLDDFEPKPIVFHRIARSGRPRTISCSAKF